MKCYKCGREKASEKIEGTMGIMVIYCCNEYHVDFDSLKPNVRQAIISQDEYILNLLSEGILESRK